MRRGSRLRFLAIPAIFLAAARPPCPAEEFFIDPRPGSGSGAPGDPFGLADLPPADDMYSEGKALSVLQPGDILLEANRQKLETLEQWDALLAKLKPGDAILLGVRRESDGQSQDFIVTLRVEG